MPAECQVYSNVDFMSSSRMSFLRKLVDAYISFVETSLPERRRSSLSKVKSKRILRSNMLLIKELVSGIFNTKTILRYTPDSVAVDYSVQHIDSYVIHVFHTLIYCAKSTEKEKLQNSLELGQVRRPSIHTTQGHVILRRALRSKSQNKIENIRMQGLIF